MTPWKPTAAVVLNGYDCDASMVHTELIIVLYYYVVLVLFLYFSYTFSIVYIVSLGDKTSWQK